MKEHLETEPQPPVSLVARVVNLTQRIGEWDNYANVRVGNGWHECGHSWEDYIIEATVVALTDTPLKQRHRLQRLILYTQSLTYYGTPGIQDAYLQKVNALTPGNTVFLTVDTEALGKHRSEFMGEFDNYYYEEDLRRGKGYSDNPELIRLREEIRRISRDGFTPESEAVNLEFVDVQELSTL